LAISPNGARNGTYYYVQNEDPKAGWNLGGWGNTRHGLEMNGVSGNDVSGKIETGRWYDIRVELRGRNIKCYLDGQLIHDVNYAAMKSLYASATRENKCWDMRWITGAKFGNLPQSAHAPLC
jgi:hypothetical protein